MNSEDFLTHELDYPLPEGRIAQHPVTPRDASRLLVFDRKTTQIEHRHFRDLPDYLNAGDLLVLNETRVMPFRLQGLKQPGGARIEMLLQQQEGEQSNRWEVMAYRSRRLRPGVRVVFGPDLRATVLEERGEGRFLVQFISSRPFFEALEEYGALPLPPYVNRPEGPTEEDRQRYQTVYASRPGSSAAPTAGLHFTDELLRRLEAKGVGAAKVTLHVGSDTFRPIQSDRVEDHSMHSEHYEMPEKTARRIREVKTAGGRVVAVGTTCVRTLESSVDEQGRVAPGSGQTRLFIRPGYQFRVVDVMITNFHLPRTTLLALVAAFAGREQWRRLYEEALEEDYRFYSFGDAMVLL
jgi:S-adenosylmethionine:tRNA ribosyltransferase-isomerase